MAEYQQIEQRFGKGLYAAGGALSGLPNTAQRISNMVLLPRTGLRTCDGSFAFLFECPDTAGPTTGQGPILAIELFVGVTRFYGLLQLDPDSPLDTPTGVTLTKLDTGGTLAAGTYSYRISAIDGIGGETLASTAVTLAIDGPDDRIQINWTAVTNAAGYRVYGRTSGSEVLLAEVSTNTYTDAGADVLSSQKSPTGWQQITGLPPDPSWLNPSNIFASDDARATVTLTQGQKSAALGGHSFGFAIPSGATIRGIELRVERSEGSLGANTIRDQAVVMLKAGSPVGDNKADTALDWPTVDAVKVYGSPTDLWGTTWTPNEVNASGFGAQVVAQAQPTPAASEEARIDHMTLTVYYSLTPSGVSPPSANTTKQIVLIKPSNLVCYTKPGDIIAKYAAAASPGGSGSGGLPPPPGGGGGGGSLPPEDDPPLFIL